MTTTPLPIDEFAKRLRTKYPGAYDSLSDAQLVQKVVNKYPEYKEHIASFAPIQAEQQPARSVTDAYDPKAEGVAQRFLGSAGAQLLSTPGQIIQTGMDPIGTARNVAENIGSSLKAYANPATRPTWEGIKSVLPEALGGGVGAVASGYTPEAAVGAKELAGTALRDQYNEVRAPIKAAAAAGKLLGAPELSEAFIPNRPGAYSAAERAPIPLSQMPNAEHLAQINAARRSAYAPPEPELGSPENPGFMSKLPARLPPSLRGDPFAPPVEETVEAGRQASQAGGSDDVMLVPDQRPALPTDRPGNAYSLGRETELPAAAMRGQPGAIDVLRQQKPVVVLPRSGGFESPNMDALRQSLGITQSVPQGNPSPFAPPAQLPAATSTPLPSITQGWLKPKKQPVLQ